MSKSSSTPIHGESASLVPYLVMLVTPLFFSSNLIFGRLAIPEVAPFTLAFLRWTGAAILLSPWVIREIGPARAFVTGHPRHWLLLGFLGMWICGGIVYLGLNTDTQHLGYVLRDGETDAPAGLKAGMRANNAVQDALTSSYRVGDTGNEVLARARKKAIDAGLEPSIYTHPIGFHGHAAGASIGFWDNQGPSDKGEHKLRANTAWSIELNAIAAVPEWGGQKVPFKSEEDAFFDGKTVRYIDGRQTEFHLIGKAPRN